MTDTRRLWRSSLRLRLTVAGVSLAGVIFVIGGFVTITLYQRSVTLSVQHTVAQTATAIASQIRGPRPPDPIPMPTGPGIPRVQVLNDRGRVITGDPASADKPAMFRLPPGTRRQQVTVSKLSLLSGRLPLSGSDELSRLAETLNGMLASLERSVDRQRRFVADAAHELRTPLAGLTATLEIAQRHPDTTRDALIGELLAGHRRLGRTLNDLLVLAAIDGRVPEKMAPVDLTGVVTDCSRRSVPEGIFLRTGTLERAVVLGNESQLSRMVGNLVDNAVRYARSTVELSLSVSDDSAGISVTDDGPGIPGPDRERVWDRFVRLDDARSRASGGNGLGLAIVRELALAHSGTATVRERAPGPGAEFVIRLPLLQGDVQSSA